MSIKAAPVPKKENQAKMTTNDFFPQRPSLTPMIYAYEDLNPEYKGLLKIGYTEVDVDRRVAQQYPTKRPDGKIPYRIVLREVRTER